MLVPVLPALACAREPGDLKVGVIDSHCRDFFWSHYGDGYCACVDAPALLSWRHSLDAMPACLDRQDIAATAFNLDVDLLEPVAGLSFQ